MFTLTTVFHPYIKVLISQEMLISVKLDEKWNGQYLNV